MNKSNWLSSLVKIEQSIQYSTPTPYGVSPFIHLNGSVPILISAPHSSIHMRNGRLKRAEGFTGSLAVLLSQITGAHALYVNYRLPADPNWDHHSPYKSFLGRLVDEHQIKFVLDIHGMSNWHKIGIALGTINGRSCPHETPHIEQTLKDHGFLKVPETTAKGYTTLNWQTFVTNHSRFTGGVSNHTVTRFVTEHLGISSIQIELCSTLRTVTQELPEGSSKTFRGNPQATTIIINAFVALINELQ